MWGVKACATLRCSHGSHFSQVHNSWDAGGRLQHRDAPDSLYRKASRTRVASLASVPVWSPCPRLDGPPATALRLRLPGLAG